MELNKELEKLKSLMGGNTDEAFMVASEDQRQHQKRETLCIY